MHNSFVIWYKQLIITLLAASRHTSFGDGPDNILSDWFPMVGFKVGMLHGGMIDPATLQLRTLESAVVPYDADFTQGYWAGRRGYFETPQDERRSTDAMWLETINDCALAYHRADGDVCLRYALGCLVGRISAIVLPITAPEQAMIVAENPLATTEQGASAARRLLPSS